MPKPVQALAPPADASAPLTTKQRALLREACRLGEATDRAAAEAMTGYGAWLIEHVFGGDAVAARNDRNDNVVWRELVSIAGDRQLSLSRTKLYAALHVAALDRLLEGTAWSGLSYSAKEALLPLREEALIRAAAVAATGKSVREVRVHVREQRGGSRRVITGAGLRARMARAHAGLDTRAGDRAVERALRDLDDDGLQALMSEAEALRDFALRIIEDARKAMHPSRKKPSPLTKLKLAKRAR